MKRAELHAQLAELLYIEDFGMVDMLMASVVANSLKIGDPVWMTLIGPSSGGKSQIIRPFARANQGFIHQLDDLTPNTLLSGTLGLEGSLLGRIGKHGMLSMDDLTVLFSKGPEERSAILSQFRMIYDGRYSKSSGNRKEAMDWTGHVGMIAGSTPSIYRYFSEVADMGERFLSYRMRAIDKHKAVEYVTAHRRTSSSLNEDISIIFRQYLLDLLPNLPKDHSEMPQVHATTQQVIQNVAEHATLLRTPVHIDERSGLVDEFPEPEMPFRVMKQLSNMAQALQCMCEVPGEELPADLTRALEWTAYSLANDKRRAYLRALVALQDDGLQLTKKNISSVTGLHTEIVKKGLDQLQALGIIRLRNEDEEGGEWELNNKGLVDIVRRLDPISNVKEQINENF